MRAALLGNGGIAESHRAAYKKLKEEGQDITLVAVCDIREEKRTAELTNGAEVYSSFEEMLQAVKGRVDYIDICLPTFLHAEYSIKCMKAGFHVLCEKPMALTVEDTQKMLDCAKETGKRLMIAQVSRFGRDYSTFAKYLKEGTLGKPKSAFFVCADGTPKWSWNDWFLDAELSGGCMLDLQAHTIDLISWYFGMPKAVSVVASKKLSEKSGYSTGSANLIYDDGFFVNVWFDWTMPHNNKFGTSRRTQINCENGYLFRDTSNKTLAIVDTEGNIKDISGESPLQDFGIRNEIEYYNNCLKTGEPFEWCPPEQSARVVKIMRAQEQSADNNGAPVYLD